MASPEVHNLNNVGSSLGIYTTPVDTPSGDSTNLHYPLTTNSNPYTPPEEHPMYLSTPPNITSEYTYDPTTNQYILTPKIGSASLPGSNFMSVEEYLAYDLQKSIDDYWKTRSKQSSGGRSGFIPPLTINNAAFQKVFGSGTIDIRPQGSAELIFGIQSTKREDPSLDVKQQRVTNFDFQEKIKMNVRAKVGDKIDFGINYDTEANFEFDNKMKLAYEGNEDEMLQLVEAGNISFPLRSNLIVGSQKLFGIKTEWQFGKLNVSTVFSQQESESKNITVEGGALIEEYYVKADEYEENKHFFLSQYFRDNYNEALSTLPAIKSGINISRMEVWVTSVGPAVEQNRNIVALMDLGEKDVYRTDVIIPYPTFGDNSDNGNNDLYGKLSNSSSVRDINTVSSYLVAGYQFSSGLEFEKVENARKLNQNEYTFNSKLGFISLNTRLNPDQVLAVSYEYTIVGSDDIFQVGEFSTDGITAPKNLIVKLLKSTSVNTKIPTWNLMMKNVYSTGAFQISPEDFRLDIVYEDPELGVRVGYLREGAIANQPLIRALGMDRLNSMMDPTPDGVFDYVDGAATNGGTIQAQRGRIYFPVIEPFGEDLRKVIDPGDPNSEMARKYAFDSLYTLTKHEARQYPNKNRFAIEGQYKSSSGSEISLQAMNVPQGSVKVTAGGVPLRENIDYTVDYTLGRVKITNEGILSSGTPINISLESNNLFKVQTKTLIGTHLDYQFNPDMRIGGTILNLTEKPITQKVNMGDEPISNTIWGIDGSYLKESRFLTKWIDALPFIETKAPSVVSLTGEFAHFIPGHPRAIGKTGTSYIDDFEGSSSGIDMMNTGQWNLASVPRGQGSMNMFPEGNLDTISLKYGYNRALFNWYLIDRLFVRNNNLTPDHIQNDKDQQSSHYVREIYEQEVFPNKDEENIPTPLSILNLSFYPDEKGPNNFDVEGEAGLSAGIDQNGKLNDPDSRWGGIMRQITQTDFEATNIEYIEFWLMDPFVDPDGNGPELGLQDGGDLYFNLGDISEDILKDGRKAFENGLPTTSDKSSVDSTIWGYVPKLQALTNSFDNVPSSREYQDIGYDGLNDAEEQDYFQSYLNRINALYPGSTAAANATADPSNDNYHYYRGTDYDNNQIGILDRYKRHNATQGNTPTSGQSDESYPTVATTLPDVEDINSDNTLSEEERYYQYRVQLRPDKMIQGENHITDVYEAPVALANGNSTTVKWYQFRVPITSPDKVVGQITSFNSIRFMRMFLKDFDETAHLRFATLDLVRNEWRKYSNELLSPGEYIPSDDFNSTTFEVTEVNIEANGEREPIPYRLPPEIEREISYGTSSLAEQNEASMVLRVCELQDGDARAVYKTADFDFRRYKKLQMFVHAEQSYNDKPLANGDVNIFIRMGTDFTENYYEYEIPLSITPWGTDDADAIWPDQNTILLELEKLIDVKMSRNQIMREQPNSGVDNTTPYTQQDGSARITVIGTPTLSSVKTIMIGIRNPRSSSGGLTDDGLAKCGEVWVNELRVTDFDEKGGWAASAILAADLADLGNVTLAGNFSTAGFGSLEQTIAERQDENIYGYDFATNLEFGKFFGEKAGLRIPVHFDYSETFKDPEYSPLNPDVLFRDDIATYATQEERDSIKSIAQDYTKRTSFNVMNVKKMHTGAKDKNRIYDIENFDVSYKYQSEYFRNIDIEYDSRVKHYGGIGYNYQNRPKAVEPFKKVKIFRNKWFGLIRDFNFYYLPKQISFKTDIQRNYSEALMRKKTASLILLEPTYIKTFNWNRNYIVRYDISKSLIFDYNSTVLARIDEPAGLVDRSDAGYTVWRDSVISSAIKFGRPTNFGQQANLKYNIPLSKIPILNWINSSVSYGSTYSWLTAPLATPDIKNTIENGRKMQGNVTANFISLYNKIDYLKKINSKSKKTSRQMGGRLNIPTAPANTDSLEKKNWGKIILDNSLRVMMALRNANISYTQADGTLLPGFNSNPIALGNDWNSNAPGMDFILGRQSWGVDSQGNPIRFGAIAARESWLTQSELLNTPTIAKHTQNLTGRITFEPINKLRVEISFRRNQASTYNVYYQFDSVDFVPYTPTEVQQFSMTYSTWRTSFVKDDETTFSNQNFENFKDYLVIIANRLAKQNEYWVSQGLGTIKDTMGGRIVDMPDGYTSTHQDVMMYAFLAAYSGQDPENLELRPDPVIPRPNWRISWTGLTDVPFIKKYFKTVTFSHAYQSTYSLNGYASNLKWKNWGSGMDDFDYIRDELNQNRFIPKNDINMVSITEQYSPLINADVTLQNSLILKLSIRKSRNLSLSMSNNQLSEVTSNELIIGTGYQFKNVPLKLKLGGSKRSFESDINLKFDFSIRENKTVLRKLLEDVDRISNGQRVLSINVSGDYRLSQRITFRLFYDQVINNPFVSTQYPNSNTNAGISLLFSLAQ